MQIAYIRRIHLYHGIAHLKIRFSFGIIAEFAFHLAMRGDDAIIVDEEGGTIMRVIRHEVKLNPEFSSYAISNFDGRLNNSVYYTYNGEDDRGISFIEEDDHVEGLMPHMHSSNGELLSDELQIDYAEALKGDTSEYTFCLCEFFPDKIIFHLADNDPERARWLFCCRTDTLLR